MSMARALGDLATTVAFGLQKQTRTADTQIEGVDVSAERFFVLTPDQNVVVIY